MAAEVRPIPQARIEAGPVPFTADQRYWRTFKNQSLISSDHNSAVTSITSSPQDTFAVTSGARVVVYNSRTRKVAKNITRFNVDDTARSGVLRNDGRILLAAGDSGIIQAFDTESRAILRQWGLEEKRRQAIHCVRWDPSQITKFLTCGDDKTVKVWDLTEEQPIWTGHAHEDYVRTGCWIPGQQGMLVSGSYDQTVRVWNMTKSNRGRPVMSFKLQFQVEEVLALNSSTIAAASGNLVAILNLITAQPDIILRSHQKAVTRLASAQGGSRLLTAGLDGIVKVHSTESWQVVASIKYHAPILSLAVISTAAGGDRHLAVGLQTGLLNIRTRIAGAEKIKADDREKRMQAIVEGKGDEYDRKTREERRRLKKRARGRGESLEQRQRGGKAGRDSRKNLKDEGADIVIEGNDRNRVKKLRGWQKLMREGHYARALDETFDHRGVGPSYDAATVVTVITALRHRSALRHALSYRSEEQLIPILEWTARQISVPRTLSLASEVLLLVLDLYSYRFQEWYETGSEDGRKLIRLVRRISKRVRKSAEAAEKAEAITGMMTLLTAGD